MIFFTIFSKKIFVIKKRISLSFEPEKAKNYYLNVDSNF